MSELNVLDHSGDTKLMWDASKPDEVGAAKDLFKKLKDKGYYAYKVEGKEGYKGEVIRDFDPNAERIIMAPRVAGGC